MTVNIANDPAASGIAWDWSMVQHDPDGDHKTMVELGEIPIPVVTDRELFDTAFPGLALKYLNGSSSIRVTVQGACRRLLIKNRKASKDALMNAATHAMLSIRTPVTTEAFIGPNDERFATRDEMRAAWMAYKFDQDNE